LIDVFRSMIDFSLRCALDPALKGYRGNRTGYTTRAERARHKRLSPRGIVLKD
jgi:hypothetical protein